MTNEEIKKSLRERLPIRHKCKLHDTAIIYAYAQAWRVSVDKNGNFISCLELVSGSNCRSLTVAPVEECEIYKGVKENGN